MFRVSKQVDYASQFLLALSKSNTTISVKDFSSMHNVSFLFMQHIVQILRKKGFIDSKRGPQGGYIRLKKDITLLDVIEAFEGELAIAECLRSSSHKSCDTLNTCSMHVIMKKTQRELEDSFSSIKL